MKKWARRSLLSLGLLMAAGLVLSGVLLRMFRAAPDWYAALDVPDSQREQYAGSAENKLIAAQNWAQALRADEVRFARAADSGATRPAARAAESMALVLDQNELNALIDKWSVMYGWKRQYEQYVDRPRVFIEGDRLILAARVKDMNSVVSLHLTPTIDSGGQLRLDVVKVMGGKLPLPDSFWTPWRDKAAAEINERLPAWRRKANISATGAANSSATAAVMGKLFLDIASHQPGDATVFLPLAEKGESVPVRIAHIGVAQGELTMQVQPLTAANRAALLQRIRQ